MICPSCKKRMKNGMGMDIFTDKIGEISDIIGRLQGYECDCGITGCRQFKVMKHHDFYTVPENHYELEWKCGYTIRNDIKPKIRDRNGKIYIKGSFK